MFFGKDQLLDVEELIIETNEPLCFELPKIVDCCPNHRLRFRSPHHKNSLAPSSESNLREIVIPGATLTVFAYSI